MADKTCSLLEFVAFCTEKNEIFDGASPRYCTYRTQELAREQYERLVREATALLGAHVRRIQYGLDWPGHLAVQARRSTVIVWIAASQDGPAWQWGDGDSDWATVNAQEDLDALIRGKPDLPSTGLKY